ncbi:hypothetical protein ACFPTR_11800 [Aliibacillus thermotolerans]|uniref:Uncharacterized protein n=1 Tax=Aliibacillus thermotolerans TaxID=1834418 RepID=A0ABW0U9V6_9BACI|nr:hypothetical protein [Aliibacillus thermotolerans]MDA3130008.1 hypothetical protein [Aliibacillus thermotolerans]
MTYFHQQFGVGNMPLFGQEAFSEAIFDEAVTKKCPKITNHDFLDSSSTLLHITNDIENTP